jgi:hypothetical protein
MALYVTEAEIVPLFTLLAIPCLELDLQSHSLSALTLEGLKRTNKTNNATDGRNRECL